MGPESSDGEEHAVLLQGGGVEAGPLTWASRRGVSGGNPVPPPLPVLLSARVRPGTSGRSTAGSTDRSGPPALPAPLPHAAPNGARLQAPRSEENRSVSVLLKRTV